METLNLFDLFARIILDTSDYDDNLDEASRNTESFAEKMKNGLSTAAKVGAAALTAAASGVAALTKSSIDQYAEYEQLVGGVDTLFKEASDTVQQYASNAYKTAGVSANTYMEQATAFSASLIQSLGGDTQAAAEYANQAIMDMSDNANKMGTDIESIQQTYQSLMRGNYAMLDNLKLGYGGTKAELERLVADASELTGEALDPAKFSDVITAIHAVQENMGITGTTAKEAATTIEGSVGMMKAAWSNLVVGIADENANLTQLISNFASSLSTVAQNVGPRILQIFQGISSAAEQIAPMIASGITTAVQNAPVFLNAAISLLQSLGSSILAQADTLLQSAMDIVMFLADAIISNVDSLAESAVSLVQSLANFVSENAGELAGKAVDLLLALANDIVENLPELASAALQIVVSLATGIINNIPRLIEAIPTLISKFVDGFSSVMSDIVNVGKNIVEGIWEGITGAGQWLKDKVSGFFDGIVDGVRDLLGIHSPSRVFMSIGEYMMQGLAIGMENSAGEVMETVDDIVDEITNRFSGLTKSLTLQQDIGDLEYEVWERTLGQNATDAQKYEMQLQNLNRQEQIQSGIVQTAAAAYEAISEQYGENSAESLSYQKTLLEESLAYQDLVDQINEVIAAKEKLYAGNVGNISYAESASGRATAETINAIASGGNEQNINLNANLVLEDGSKLATWQLPLLINAGRAAGTPIANPQVG